MAKYLKRYNKETNQWELVSAPDVSVEQRLEDGSNITDTNVFVTNVNYAKESGDTTLDETLTVIGDDISRLQRNVSWLAEHGGAGGSGGGGGTVKSFGIEVISPALVNNAAYVTGKTFDIEFMITGGSEGDICTYSYAYDGTPTDYIPIEVNKSVKVHIDNTASTEKEHSMLIRAINPYGTNITAKNFTIYESSLSVAFDVDTAGDDYNKSTGVYNIRKNSTYGNIPLLITNGLMNSTTVLTGAYNMEQSNIEFVNSTTKPQKVAFSLWNILPEPAPGRYYVITFNASATLGTNTIYSNEIQVRVYIISPTEMTVVLGVNGTSGEDVEAPLNSSLAYNFRVYVPVLQPPVDITYYAAKIVNGAESTLILGQYYDENTHEEGATFADNPSASVGTLISSQYALSTAHGFQQGQTVQLYVKVWDTLGTRTQTVMANITITKESNDIFPRQSNLRSGVGTTGGTIFASWNKDDASEVSKMKWTSNQTDYAFISNEFTGNTVTLDINVLNGNDASGIHVEDGEIPTPYMRLQNHAYAYTDMSRYAAEIAALTTNIDDTNYYGFTISFSIKADLLNDNEHTLLLWGDNGVDNSLINGIRIDSDKVRWRVWEITKVGNPLPHDLICPISPDVRTTVDFSYVINDSNSATARIYVNGILNAAANIYRMSPRAAHIFPNIAYFGASYRNGSIERYADLNIYEFSIYTRNLNDLQIIVNSKNSRFYTLADYNQWKTKNFITANELNPAIPESVFFNNGDYIEEFSTAQVSNIASRSTNPTLYIYFSQDAGFNKDWFYAKHTTEETGRTFDGVATYYDPDTQRTVQFAVKVTLQGTSTLGYRIKNLEMYVDETFTTETGTYVKLFQPKKEWFPESQFTLKADVVDSAHANNAVLGEWINNSGAFENNPAMANLEGNRPLDVDDAGNEPVPGAVHEDVTIKHTLEGFPILMFIAFSDSNAYTFLGIYSFNLGRYSYYNMGMKFLKSFSRRDAGGQKVACPKLINYYEEKDTLGDVKAGDIFSFEMGNAANEHLTQCPVWSQYRNSVIQTYGDFKYPSVGTTDDIWNKLCTAFESIARFEITSYYTDSYTGYQNIHDFIYDKIAGKYIDTGDEIAQQNLTTQDIEDHINVHNAIAYFVIANAFGMTDSLGKNMTLRTWDNGETWYTCFYDMDTALALANDGTESNPVTVSIDKVTMVSDPETQTSVLRTTYHDEESKYAAYLSKIWGVFRDDMFINRHNNPQDRYEYIWNSMRSTNGKLSRASNFTDIMADRVDKCGEMVYDYDYNTKYIDDTNNTQDSGVTPAITFLHGTRVEFVKDWLRKHFYFLDGMFDANRLGQGVSFSYADSPYNSDIFDIVASFSSAMPILAFTVKVTTPTFLGFNVGSDAFKKYYIDTENTDTRLYFANGTSSNAQINIKGSTLISKLEGLQGGFQAIGNNEPGVARALSEFNVESSNGLTESPFTNKVFILGGKSSLETINLSNTKGPSPLNNYVVDLGDFDKLINVNISNSDVTALGLPRTSLQRLDIRYSNLVSFTLVNQNILTGISFDGCSKLQSIHIDNCNAITDLNISDKINLSTISITNCDSLNSVTISGNTSLTTIELSNNRNLKTVRIINCRSANLKIIINGSALQNITINEINSSIPVTLPSRAFLSGVTSISIDNCYYFGGFKYGSEDLETYGENDDYVLDLTPFTSLEGENISARNVLTMAYIRVPNDAEHPFDLRHGFIDGSKNVLTRIFGCFAITEIEQFFQFAKFYVREPLDLEGGKTPFDDSYYQWDNTSYGTNIVINQSDMSSAFRMTSCSISDVYYIFKQCRHGVALTDIESGESMFRDCKSLRTTMQDSINPGIFSNLPELTNINNIFNGANIGGYIDNAILVPIKDNIEEFVNVFGTNETNIEKYYTKDDECFFPSGNNITVVEGFNPLPYNTEYEVPNPVFDTEMLKTLTKVEIIENSFNDCKIDFTNGEGDVNCDLFKTTVKLKKIGRSFLRVIGTGSLKNIFGGNSSSPSEFPEALEEIRGSFSFIEDPYCDHESISGECPINHDTGHKGVLMPIGNSFFKRIKGSIKAVGGKSRSYYEEKCFFSERNSVRETNAIRKYIDLDDCDGENFCYKIFNGCDNLEEVPYFFEGMDFNVIGGPSSISLLFDGNGNSMFKGLTKLKNITGLFSTMKNVKYTLSSGCAFEDCAIESASNLFKESNTANSAKRIGMVPYKLFYQGDVENTISDSKLGITERTADSMGILADFKHYIEDLSGNPEEYRYVGTDTADKISLNFTYKLPKCLISNLSSVFEFSDSTELVQFSSLDMPYEEWIEDNENYNPIMFYTSQDESGNTVYSYNMSYNPYKKKWNKFVYDGTKAFTQMVEASVQYQTLLRVYAGEIIPEYMDDYGNPILDKDLPDGFRDYDDYFDLSALSDKDTGIEKDTDTYPIYNPGTGLFSIQNYFVPQDIFRYCANNRSTTVNSAFENGCPTITHTADMWSCGVKGRIPPYIFEPIRNAITLSRVFYNCKGLLPHRWATYVSGAPYSAGTAYPSTLISGMTNLSTFSTMFSNCTMWGRVTVPESFFSTNTELADISSIWNGMKWVEDTVTEQFPITLFVNNSKLSNLSGLFAYEGPYRMSSNLFNERNNPNIKNTSSFLFRCVHLMNTSRVPTFWDETKWIVPSFENTFAGISQEIIDAQGIPPAWYTEM